MSDSAYKRTLLVLSLAAFASAASVRICDPLLPALADTYGVTAAQAAQTATVYAFTYGLLQLAYGPVGDRFGKLRVITYACLACTVGTLASAFAPTLGWLLFCRFLAGITAAALIPLSMAWIGDQVRYQERQAALAHFLTGVIGGLIVGQFIGGLFADLLHWRATFVFLAAVFLAAGIVLWFELRRRGAAGDPPAPTVPGQSLAARYFDIVGRPWPRLVIGITFLEGAALFGGLAFIPTYLHLRFDLSLTAAGAILAAYGIGGLGYTFIARWLIRHLGEQGLAVGGGLLMGVAFGALVLMGSAWGWAIPATFAAGLGYYMLHNTLQIHATQMSPAARGTAMSLFASALFLGNAAGVGGAGLLIGVTDIVWVFALTAVAMPLLGIVFCYRLRAHLRKTREGRGRTPETA